MSCALSSPSEGNWGWFRWGRPLGDGLWETRKIPDIKKLQKFTAWAARETLQVPRYVLEKFELSGKIHFPLIDRERDTFLNILPGVLVTKNKHFELHLDLVKSPRYKLTLIPFFFSSPSSRTP